MASLEVLVTTRAAADRVGPVEDGVLRVRVTRPPADGAANRATQRLVARALGLAPSEMRLVAGERARRKRFAIEGLTQSELEARLVPFQGSGD